MSTVAYTAYIVYNTFIFFSATTENSNFKFGTQLGFELAYQETTFRTKFGKGLG